MGPLKRGGYVLRSMVRVWAGGSYSARMPSARQLVQDVVQVTFRSLEAAVVVVAAAAGGEGPGGSWWQPIRGSAGWLDVCRRLRA